MKFEQPHHTLPVRDVRLFRLFRSNGLIGFEIEATDQLPDNPSLWFERQNAILHHHGHYFIVLPHVPDSIIAEIKESSFVIIDEKHQRRFTDSPSPFGMMPQGTARLYEVPVLTLDHTSPIRDIFADAIEIDGRDDDARKNHSLSDIFSA